LDPYLGSHKVDIRPAWGVRFGYLCTWLLSSNGLGYHGETGSLWYSRIAQLVRAFGICPEGPGFNPRSGHFYKFNSKFRRQLFHSSLAHILMPLKPWMSKPKVTRCADGHFRRVIYGIGPYIADYPEQALLACVVSGWCPRFDFTVYYDSAFLIGI
jgi:hypothetical protein